MTSLFISYSHNDKEFAYQLANSLSELGCEVWIDIISILPGMNWANAIHTALLVSDYMLLIVSPNSMASENVTEEWQFFRYKDKPIIPLLLQEAELHFQLSNLQYIDFSAQDYDQALEQLQRRLNVDEPQDMASKPQTLDTIPEQKSTNDKPASLFTFNAPIYGGQFAETINNRGDVDMSVHIGDDRHVKLAFQQLNEILKTLELMPEEEAEAEAEIQQIEEELLKSEKPNRERLKTLGKALLKRSPKLLGALISLFASPVVAKTVEMTGEIVGDWVASLG